MSRCKCCNIRLESFDDYVYCKKCIAASEDESTQFVDYQHKLITDTKQGCVYTTMKKGSE